MGVGYRDCAIGVERGEVFRVVPGSEIDAVPVPARVGIVVIQATQRRAILIEQPDARAVDLEGARPVLRDEMQSRDEITRGQQRIGGESEQNGRLLLQSTSQGFLPLGALAACRDILQQRLHYGPTAKIHTHAGRLDPDERAVLAHDLHFNGRSRLALRDYATRSLLQQPDVVGMGKGENRAIDDLFDRCGTHESERCRVGEQAVHAIVDEDGLGQRIHECAITLLALAERFIDTQFAWRG